VVVLLCSLSSQVIFFFSSLLHTTLPMSLAVRCNFSLFNRYRDAFLSFLFFLSFLQKLVVDDVCSTLRKSKTTA